MAHEEDQSGAESSSGPAAKVRRARIACLQCRNRRTKCDADPPRPCQYCIQNSLKCEWPASDTVKKRGRKSSHASTAAPQTMQYGSMDGQMDWWPGASTGMSTDLFAESQGQMSTSPQIDQPLENQSQTPLGNLLAQYDAFLTDRTADGSWMGMFAGQTPANGRAQTDSSGSLQLESPYATAEDPLSWMTMLRSPAPPTPGVRRSSVMEARPQTEPAAFTSTTFIRSHGASAVVQGPEEVSLHICRMAPIPQPEPAEHGLMLHLIDVFIVNFGCFFPALSKAKLHSTLRRANGRSSFLLDAVASLSAKFSDRRGDARSHRYDLGEPFRRRSMAKLGAVLGVPRWETIVALVVLAWECLGSGTSAEAWMLSGLAMRMCQDMGLHQRVEVTREERLAFWSALITEYLLCLAEGRRPTISSFSILQKTPLDEDCISEAGADGAPPENPPRHPFPFVAMMLQKVGPLIDAVNSEELPTPLMAEIAAQLDAWYGDLHVDIAWNAANLQLHHKAGQGTAYLFLHISAHAMLSLRFLLESSDFVDFSPNGSGFSDSANPFPRWLHSPRFIGDMLVLGNLIDPKMVLANPFFGQCFLSAGKAFARDRRVRQTLSDRPEGGLDEEKKKHLLFRQALVTLTTYWRCLKAAKQAFERSLNEQDADAITALTITRTDERFCLEDGVDADILPEDLAQMTPSTAANNLWSSIFPPTVQQ